MNNVYKSEVRSKAGELLRFKQKLAAAGLIVPPMSLVKHPFSEYGAEIEKDGAGLQKLGKKIEFFKSICKPEGPLLPYLMVRNNGRPEGTGEGQSIPVALDEPLEHIAGKVGIVQRSDPDAQGALLQPFVGQFAFRSKYDGTAYAPFLSGIAYTAGATESGNAVIEWVFGHPAKAVGGEASYLAFNRQTMDTELAHRNIFYGKGKETFVLKDMGGSRYRKLYLSRDFADWSEGIPHICDVHKIFRPLQVAILALGGAHYLEWAITYVNKQAQMFALQISEVGRKFAGIPTWLHQALEHADELMREAEVDDAAELKKLKELYKKAAEDPHTIAAGFDVLGRNRQEFGVMIWLPEIEGLDGCWRKSDPKTEPAIFAFSGSKIPAQSITAYRIADKVNIGAVVEIVSKRNKETFKAHFNGYCETRGMLGLGGVEDMREKLYALFPKEPATSVGAGGLIIRGKFVLDVDECLPFGTLRVERVDSVEKIRNE